MDIRLRFIGLGVRSLIALSLLALCLATPASAEVIPITVSMDGAQANAGAGTGSAGTGTADLTFDTASKVLTWSITWSGLTGDPTLMHFHGPALPNQNAAVRVSTGVAGPPVEGNAILAAGDEADLLAGLWYLNLHTSTSSGGEIRGQVEIATAVPSMSLYGFVVLVGLIVSLMTVRRLYLRPRI